MPDGWFTFRPIRCKSNKTKKRLAEYLKKKFSLRWALKSIRKSYNRCRWYLVWAFLEASPKDKNPYYRLIRFPSRDMACIRYPIISQDISMRSTKSAILAPLVIFLAWNFHTPCCGQDNGIDNCTTFFCLYFRQFYKHFLVIFETCLSSRRREKKMWCSK